MKSFRDQLHPTWQVALEPVLPLLDQLESKLEGLEFLPARENVMRAFLQPLQDVRVLILGQDPYPNPQYAMGLSFSVNPGITKFPQSLKNIFIEYEQDTGFAKPNSGDLSLWAERGVLLLNRTLTISPGESGSHADIGWSEFILHVAQILGKRDVVAVLWGARAQELSYLFEKKIESAHPSPLSAYRGFFGSKPFTKVNELLESSGLQKIDWRLA
jgi:uracil-DNA glycosylase